MSMLFPPKEIMRNIRIHNGSVYLVGEVTEEQKKIFQKFKKQVDEEKKKSRVETDWPFAHELKSFSKYRTFWEVKPNITKSISNEVLFSCPDHGHKLPDICRCRRIRCSYGINGIKPAKANERKIGNREKPPKLAERFLHGLGKHCMQCRFQSKSPRIFRIASWKFSMKFL